MSDGLDLQHLAPVQRRRVVFVDRFDRRHGDGQQDERRKDRPYHLKAGVAVDLRRYLVIAPHPESEYRVDEHSLYEDENGDSNPEDEVEQVGLLLGDRARGVECGLIVRRRTGSQNCYESNQD